MGLEKKNRGKYGRGRHKLEREIVELYHHPIKKKVIREFLREYLLKFR